MKFSLIILFTLFFGYAQAQTFIPDLVTDRPDQTESSSVVPFKSIQIETGFLMENDDLTKSIAFNTTLIRYGVMKNVELRFGLEYLGEKNTSIPNSTITGISPTYLGFKANLSKENGWKPEIAFLGAMVLPFIAEPNFKPSYPAADMRFSFSHTLSDQVSVGYNLGAEWNGEDAIPAYFYSLAVGFSISEHLSMFAESFGTIAEADASEHLFDAGFTYLIQPNLQFDISAGIGLNKAALANFISCGITYRLLN